MRRSVRPHTRIVTIVAAMTAAFGLVVLPASPASAAPVPPTFGLPPEGYAASDPQSTCDPVAKPGVVDLRDVLNQAYGTHPSSITRACSASGTSEHKEGRALDYMLDVNNATERAVAGDILAWLFATDQFGANHAIARRLGIMYLIWNREIWSAARHAEGWRPYTGENPHTDHIHFSFSWAGALRQTSWWTGRLPGVSAVVYNGTPRFFARAASDGKLAQYYLESGEWKSQTVLNGRIVGTPGAVIIDSTLMVFASGTDGTPWWYSYNGIWNMSPINLGKITSGVSAVSFGGPRFFARGLDGQLIQYLFQNDEWRWDALGGSIVGTPAAVVDNGVLKVFVTGTDGTPFQYTHGSSWSPPQPLSDCGEISGGVGAVVYSGLLRLFARGLGGELVQCYYDGGWHRQTVPVAAAILGHPGAMVDGTTLRVFASGTDGTPWEFFFSPGHSWDRRSLTGKIA